MNKKKPYVKLALDAAMGVTFALLFNTRVFGGLAFHEIAGIAIGIAILTHIGLNLNFVKKITLRLFDKNLPHKTRLSYGLNVLLLLSMIFVIFSGLVISRVVLQGFQLGNERWFSVSHMSIAYLTLALIGVHIGLHWHWVMKVTQRLLHLKMSKARARILMTCAAVFVLLFGVYQVYSTHYISRLQMVGNVFGILTAAAEESGIERYDFDERTFNNEPAPFDGTGMDQENGFERRAMGGFSRGEHEGGRQSPNFIGVILTYFGIMAVFAGITYYADKWACRRKRAITA
ncbi:DUF4405 domain-containing protein [Paenibacillus durus]|uniref:Flavinylation-associated cytochrome domain-containing protein n=1 Tax=Paenibacillus durus TaxID=44251 RepID=A0A089IVK7_PAEDU|nr:DUF4405 domain-containing protein [Paenibacillus durus]AIQ12999.1 hypothetical protein PDUR_14565 [Paenibacillus durus]